MTATKRAAEAAPEFPYVLADTESLAPQLRSLQVRRLMRRFAISTSMAVAIVQNLYVEAA